MESAYVVLTASPQRHWQAERIKSLGIMMTITPIKNANYE
jgi:hypothetical protein